MSAYPDKAEKNLLGMRTEIEYDTYIRAGGEIEKRTVVYFDSKEELIEYWESLGEFAEKVYGSMIRLSLTVKTEWVTLAEYQKDMILTGDEEE